MPHHAQEQAVREFIARWKESAAAERANYQLFLSELCDVLGVERPVPSRGGDDNQNAYVFERAVVFHNPDGTTNKGRIDLYKRGCFVLEAKQGSDKGSRGAGLRRGTRGWDVAMRSARGQAEQYVRALPPEEGNPPFIIVVDVGYSFELYSDFSRAGKTYVPFPDARTHRIHMDDLTRGEVRERLRQIWTDPAALDPSRYSARVTREVAGQLAALARSLEESGYGAERVSSFLMRAIFTMFAEDVRLIPQGSFTEALLEVRREGVEIFPHMIGSLWSTMNAGGFSPVIRKHVIQFNGGLFEDCEALPLNIRQLDLLIEASRADWKDVEPAIFGTLLERALDPHERHKLGAHYTPRAYVERLVMPTIIEPLRQEWEAVLAAAVTLANAGKLREAAEETRAFHRRLCRVRVLDPACGSGNFLYVTLEHLKRLEGEVLDALHGFGDSQGVLEDTGLSVDPHQLLGIEVNPRAAAITDLVLWIGYLQWHFRTRGEVLPPQPVIKKFHNIETRDAILAYDRVEEVTDDAGQPVTRWDGRTTKKHPVTGEDVPDDTARVPLLRYINPRKAEWPEADYLVGNPPFIANRNMRAELGDGYVDALREAYVDEGEAIDYVMYFWTRAALSVGQGIISRAGLITTNSIRLILNQEAVVKALSYGAQIIFAIPDHPWPSDGDSAKVRVSMTVLERSGEQNQCRIMLAPDHNQVKRKRDQVSALLENEFTTIHCSRINPDLTSGSDISQLVDLKATENLCYSGMKPYAKSLIITDELSKKLFPNKEHRLVHAPIYRNGQDVAQVPRGVHAIDLFGLSEQDVKAQMPEVYQYLLDYTKPERSQDRDPKVRDNWWLFQRNRPEFRSSIKELRRYIATVENSPLRYFVFLDSAILPDQKLRLISSDDAFILGVLSTRIHTLFSLRLGGRQGIANTPVYNTRCFNQFPFPDCTEEQKARILELGESLDAHRKRQQAQYPTLTITEMYNVLEKLRRGEALSEKERVTHEQGLVSVLKQIHDELDAAVFEAYGWPQSLTDEEILERLVRLNAERAAEERRGLVRWLRPEFQKPAAGVAAAFGEELAAAAPAAAKQEKQPWPKSMPEQARAVRQALAAQASVVTPQQLARAFTRARVERVEELLQTLVSLGQARQVADGQYTS